MKRAARVAVVGGALAVAVALALIAFLVGRDAREPDDAAAPGAAGGRASGADDARLVAPPDAAVAVERATVTAPALEPERTPAPARSAHAALAVEVVYAADESPVPHEVVYVTVWGPGKRRDAREGLTGADGRCRFEEVPPGDASLSTHSGGSLRLALTAGEEHAARVAIEVGTSVDGTVVDELRVPVAGADVWLSRGSDARNGRVVARTDGDGRFRLRDLRGARWLAARAAGHAPSRAYEMAELAGETVSIELRLRGAGGALEGLVLDPAGAPAADAEVELYDPNRNAVERDVDGTRLSPSPKLVTRTRDDGGFALRGIEPGRQLLRVRHAGAAPHVEWIRIEAGLVAHVTVALQPEARIVGTVRDGDGEPVPDAWVGVKDPWRDSYLSPLSSTHSASDGTFVLGGLAGGAVDVRASATDRGDVEASLVLEPGVETRWDAVLVAGASVGGVLVDDEGEALADWRVAAIERSRVGHWLREARTDANGAFLILDLPDGELALEVRTPDPWTGGPALLVPSFERGARDLRLVVPRERHATARIVGRVVSASGKELSDLEVYAAPEHAQDGLHGEVDADGRFEIGPLRPGRYRLRASARGYAERVAEPLELAPDATVDAGTIQLTAGGDVRVVADFPDGAGVHCWLYDEHGRHVASFPPANGEARSKLVAPGTYVLLVHGAELAAPTRTVQVADGQTTDVEVELAPAAFCRFAFTAPDDAAPWFELRVRVTDDSGRLALPLRLSPDQALGESRWGIPLLPGRYRVDARTDTGLAATGSLVADVEAEMPPASFELR